MDEARAGLGALRREFSVAVRFACANALPADGTALRQKELREFVKARLAERKIGRRVASVLRHPGGHGTAEALARQRPPLSWRGDRIQTGNRLLLSAEPGQSEVRTDGATGRPCAA